MPVRRQFYVGILPGPSLETPHQARLIGCHGLDIKAKASVIARLWQPRPDPKQRVHYVRRQRLKWRTAHTA